MKEPKAKSIHELRADYLEQMVESNRKAIAVSRQFPGKLARFRRAAPVGPNSVFALIFTFAPDEGPKVQTVPYADVEQWAKNVSTEDVFERMAQLLPDAQ